MKIAGFLFYFILMSLSVKAQEFYGPDDRDLMAVSLNLLNESQKIIMSVPKKDCSDDMSIEAKVTKNVGATENREVHCICELGENGDKKTGNLFESLIGKYESSELVLNTGNDNFLHGALQRGKYKVYDGDDRGRTFSGGVDYTLLGSEGRLNLNLDSTGFGKLMKVNGYSRNESGEYYLKFRELNTLKLSADKYLSKDEASRVFVTGEFKFINETDTGNLSRSVQEFWHHYTKESFGMTDVIQYKYITDEKDKNTVTLMGGMGKEWFMNMGNWKCDASVQVKMGMSVDDTQKSMPEIMGRASAKIQHSALPWVALSTWVQGSNGFMGPATEGGVMLSFEKKISNVIIKPFIGIERHKTKMDTKFGSAGNPYENYHVLGVTIKY